MLGRLVDAVTRPRKIAGGRAAGLKLAVRHAADPDFARGTYERPLQDAVAENLSAGDVFYDVGANIGFFSLIAARQVGSRGHVYAFEPVPSNVAAIRRSQRLNGLDMVEVFGEAVGGFSGRSELLLARHIGGAALASAGAPPDLDGRMQIDVVTLDEAIVRRGLRPPTLVKIDVEGAEADVLRGMAETLRAIRPSILYEVDDATLGGLERKAGEIAALLREAGYDLSTLPPGYPAGGWHVRHMLARPGS